MRKKTQAMIRYSTYDSYPESGFVPLPNTSVLLRVFHGSLNSKAKVRTSKKSRLSKKRVRRG